MAVDPLLVTLLVLYNILVLISNWIIINMFYGGAFRSFLSSFLIITMFNLILSVLTLTVDPFCFKQKLEYYDNMFYAPYVSNDTTDDRILEDAPPSVSDDKSFLVLSSDEEIEEQAMKNIEEQIEVQPTILDSARFKEDAEEQVKDKWLKDNNDARLLLTEDERVTLNNPETPESVKNKLRPVLLLEDPNADEEKKKIIRRSRASDLKINIEDELLKPFESEIVETGEEQYEQYLKDNFELTDYERKKVDDSGNIIPLTEDEMRAIRQTKVLSPEKEADSKKSGNLQEAIEQKNKFLLQREILRARKQKLKDIYNTQLQSILITEQNNLLENEINYLSDQRYVNANIYKSKELMNAEYKNPYNILPLDLWYRPEKGAKDLTTGKSCVCPSELRLDDINYSTFDQKNPYNILPLDLWYRPEKGVKDFMTEKSCNCPSELKLDEISYSPYDQAHGDFK